MLFYTDVGWTRFPVTWDYEAGRRCKCHLGHPLTTGLPTIDYSFFETSNLCRRRGHYRETCSSRTANYYYRPEPDQRQIAVWSQRCRPSFALPAKLFKLHPTTMSCSVGSWNETLWPDRVDRGGADRPGCARRIAHHGPSW